MERESSTKDKTSSEEEKVIYYLQSFKIVLFI
jgi:hypothetical protein